MNARKNGIHLSPREAVLLLRAAKKSTTREGGAIAAKLADGVRRMRLHMDPRCAGGCGEEVPELGLACSGACATKVPLRLNDYAGHPVEGRPMPGEVWGRSGDELEITTVDPSGRWFNYVVMRGGEKRFGRLGQNDLVRVAKIR